MVISLDGNIGAGKSTLLEAIRSGLPEVEVVVEPVGEWTRLKNAEGKSLLELFYEDKRRWAYTFQNCAILTRLRSLKAVLRTTTKKNRDYGTIGADGSVCLCRDAEGLWRS